MAAVLVGGQDLHRDVPRLGFLLQLVEHGPAEHVGQEDVERHRRRQELAGQGQGLGAAARDQRLQPAVAGEIDQDARVVRIVLDDEQRGVVGPDVGPIVGHDLEAFRQPRVASVRIGSDGRAPTLPSPAMPIGPT